MYQVSTMSWVLIYFLSFQHDIWIPVQMDSKCKNKPDRFCYICAKAFPNRQTKITDFVKRVFILESIEV